MPYSTTRTITGHALALRAFSRAAIEKALATPDGPLPQPHCVTMASTSDERGDLRTQFPWLVIASARYFGWSSEGMRQVQVDENDVYALRQARVAVQNVTP